MSAGSDASDVLKESLEAYADLAVLCWELSLKGNHGGEGAIQEVLGKGVRSAGSDARPVQTMLRRRDEGNPIQADHRRTSHRTRPVAQAFRTSKSIQIATRRITEIQRASVE